MNKFLVTVALGAIAVSAGAAAQAPGGGRGQRDQTRAEVQQRADMFFQMMDANHDGTVTKAEAQQALASFGAADAGAGAGASAGRMGMMQRMVDRLFATTPSVTQQQLEALMLARFDAQDLNHDGTVTAAEREQSRAARGGAAAAPAGTTTPTQAQ